jgi:hypothetical protein
MSSKETLKVTKEVDLKAFAPKGHWGLVVQVTPETFKRSKNSSRFSMEISFLRHPGCSNIAMRLRRIITLKANMHRFANKL